MKTFKKYWLLLFIIFDIILALFVIQVYPPSAETLTAKSDNIKADKAPKQKIEATAVQAPKEENAKGSTKTEKKDPKEPEKKAPKAADTKEKLDIHKVVLDAPLVKQKPELDRGCEVTSLDMMLNDAGVDVDKMTLADQIKKIPFRTDGVRGNPNDGFVGNIETFNQSGYGVYHGPLTDLAEKYLPNRIIDLTGKSFESVIDQLKEGLPVMVIINAEFKPLPDSQFTTWHTNTGDVKITYQEHAVLVTGFDDDHIYYNNPLGGKNEKSDRDNFIKAWEQMGSQAISYKKKQD